LWLRSCTGIAEKKSFLIIFIALGGIISATPYFGAFWPHGQLQRAVQIFSDFWLGVYLYTLMALVVLLLIKFIMKKIGKGDMLARKSKRYVLITGSIILVLIVCVCGYGYWNSKNTVTTKYDASVDKTCAGIKTMKIVEIADFHLGYNAGEKEMAKVVKLVNAQHPDLVCISGDIFNNSYSAIKDPDKVAKTLAGIKSKYGVYACWGNHDVNESILFGFTFSSKKTRLYHTADMYSFLKKANIRMLEDESVLVDGKFYLVGRLDEHKPGNASRTRKSITELTSGLDKSKPVFLLDHEPSGLQTASNAGVDLDLSGHTHDGQFFPLNLTENIMWENPYGKIMKGKMTSIVTSGTGVFGPSMRVGTRSEVLSLNVTFK
jgi:predicted MPP superfamily phosphohydrolase